MRFVARKKIQGSTFCKEKYNNGILYAQIMMLSYRYCTFRQNYVNYFVPNSEFISY